MTTTTKNRFGVPTDWRLKKDGKFLAEYTGTRWVELASDALPMTKAEAAGFADIYGGEAVQL